MTISLELKERFLEKFVPNEETGCWDWTAAKMGRGYGFIKIPGTRKQIGAHRLSYLIFHGELQENDNVCHSCDRPGCVKPSHLFVGTTKDNLQDMKAKDRHLKGSRNAMSKLTDQKVRQIHKLSSEGLSQGKIAKTFGVGQSTVWKILKGERWEHIFKELGKDLEI